MDLPDKNHQVLMKQKMSSGVVVGHSDVMGRFGTGLAGVSDWRVARSFDFETSSASTFGAAVAYAYLA